MLETWEDRQPKGIHKLQVAGARIVLHASQIRNAQDHTAITTTAGRTTCLIAHWAVGIAMASIALPLPFRRLLLKIRNTQPCAQRLLILSIDESRMKAVRQGI